MTQPADDAVIDWAGDIRAYALAWGVPTLAVVAAAFADAPARTAVWVAALLGMGCACLANAWRCGRTHCRYTGPFYLCLIVPVLLHGAGLVPLGPYAWWILGATILLGGKFIWLATEAIWGKFTAPGA